MENVNNNLYEEINERIKISDLKDMEVVSKILEDINTIDDAEKKNEIIANLFKQIYDEYFKYWMDTLPEVDVIDNSISKLRETFINVSGLSVEEVDAYFQKNNITVDKVVNDMLEKVNIEISELELELKDVIEKSAEANMSPVEYLENEIKRLEEQKSKETKENNEKIAAIIAEMERRSKVIDISNDDINNLISEYEEQLQEMYHLGVDESLNEAKNNLVNEIKKLNEELLRRENVVNLPSVELEKRIEELEKVILEKKSQLDEMLKIGSNSHEFIGQIGNLENEIVGLEIDLKELIKLKKINDIEKELSGLRNDLGNKIDRFVGISDEELEKRIEELEKVILGKKSQLDEMLKIGSNLHEFIGQIGNLENEINDLEVELNDLKKTKQMRSLENLLISLKVDFVDKLSNEEINQLILEYEEQLQEMYHVGVDGSLNDDKNKLIEKINKLKEELEKRKNMPVNDFSGFSNEELKQKLKELEERNKYIQSTIDRQVTELKDKLKKAKCLDRLKKFGDRGRDIDEPVPAPVIPEGEIEQKEKNEKFWKKCLAFTGGLVVGLTLSCIPGICPIIMTVSTAKLVINGIKFITNKFPEGKIATIVKGINEKIKNSERINDFKENHPGIVNGVRNVRDKINEILAKKYVNLFINGVSTGYLVGNIFEMITGKNIAKYISDAIDKSKVVVAPTPTGPTNPGTTGTGSITPSTPDPVVPAPTISQVSLKTGEVFDISGLSEGFVSSTSNTPVSLLTSVGKEAVVDKFVTLPSGEVMVHFKQINGSGYAWFKKSVVEEHLTKIAEAAIKNGKII